MARSNFRIEQGLEILESNGTSGVWLIKGAGAPTGTSGETSDAPVGSVWFRTDGEGEVYHKVADTDSATDWEALADKSVYTLLGVAFDAEDLGTFTGDIIADNDSVKDALQALETELVDTRDNTDDLITLSGVAENAENLGTFTGTTIADNETVKGALQDLEDAIEAIAGGAFESVDIPAATPTTVSTCATSACNGVEYEVLVFEQAAQGNKEMFKHTVIHNAAQGPYADATAFDEATHTKLKLADIGGLTFTAKLSGTGEGSQVVGLEISATAAITVKVRRTEIPL